MQRRGACRYHLCHSLHSSEVAQPRLERGPASACHAEFILSLLQSLELLCGAWGVVHELLLLDGEAVEFVSLGGEVRFGASQEGFALLGGGAGFVIIAFGLLFAFAGEAGGSTGVADERDLVKTGVFFDVASATKAPKGADPCGEGEGG